MLEEDVGNKITGSCFFLASSLHFAVLLLRRKRRRRFVSERNVCSEVSLNGKVMDDWLACAVRAAASCSSSAIFSYKGILKECEAIIEDYEEVSTYSLIPFPA